LPQAKRDAFYQIVLFPAKIGAIVNELYVTAAKNNLYASQKRASTNAMAAKTRYLFQADTAMMYYYNHIYANGNWNHFMDQTHLGYRDWMHPRKNSLDAIKLNEIAVPDSAIMGVSLEGTELSWPGASTQAVLPEFDLFSNRHHFLEIFNRGKAAFEYEILSNVDWLKFSETRGQVWGNDKRITVSVDEAKLPAGRTNGVIAISGAGKTVSINVSAFNPQAAVKGFVESGGYVAIEAEHYSKNTETDKGKWIKVEDYGLTLSGMRATAPANAPAAIAGNNAPCLEYPIHLFSGDSVQLTFITPPLLNFLPERDIKIAVAFDDSDPQYITLVSGRYKVHFSNPDWAQSVVNQARRCVTTLKVGAPGHHLLKIWMVDPGVVLQKIVVDTGGLKPSYLGPPESILVE